MRSFYLRCCCAVSRLAYGVGRESRGFVRRAIGPRAIDPPRLAGGGPLYQLAHRYRAPVPDARGHGLVEGMGARRDVLAIEPVGRGTPRHGVDNPVLAHARVLVAPELANVASAAGGGGDDLGHQVGSSLTAEPKTGPGRRDPGPQEREAREEAAVRSLGVGGRRRGRPPQEREANQCRAVLGRCARVVCRCAGSLRR